ncbi:hypothetical protein Tco_0366201 [Tanacetum coccineum]
MDNPNLTMEEYIRLKEEKAHKRRKMLNWQTATYGKIKVDDDFYDLRSMEAEFLAIVVNDDFAPKDTLQCKSQVSIPVNDGIDFRISFDESNDEDYTIICDKNSFSYKMISDNNLKTDSENDYEKVMPSISSPTHAISYCDDLDFFKDFKNEFPAIVYNDAQTSKSDLLTEPILYPQHIDEFGLNDETSLSEYDKEEQNVLYFNDLFFFNIIHPDDLKSEKDKDDNDIDITDSLLDNEITHGSTMLFETSQGMFSLLYFRNWSPRMDRAYSGKTNMAHEGLEYTDSDIADFESRLERIYTREIHRVQVVDFQGMPELLRDGLFARMAMEHRDKAGVVVFTSHACRRLFDTRGPLVCELILEFLSMLRFREGLLDLDAPSTIQFQLGRARRHLSWRKFILALGLHIGEEMESPGFARYWSESERMIPRKGDLHDYWKDISTDGDFLGPPPFYSLIRDPVLRLSHKMMAHNIVGRSQTPEKEVCRWEEERGPERQLDAAAGAPAVAEDALVIDEGDQAVLAPMQAPQQPSPPPPAPARPCLRGWLDLRRTCTRYAKH